MAFRVNRRRHHQIRLAFAILIMSVGCGKSTPGVEVNDPRQYTIDNLAAIELNTWWEPYRNNDPQFLQQLVDDSIKRDGPLPTDSKELDHLIKFKLAGRFSTASLGSAESRAIILANAEQRFDNPPIVIEKGFGSKPTAAVLDYHHLPGEWKKGLRGGMRFDNHPAMDGMKMKQDAFISSLRKLHDQFPDSNAYEIRYRFFVGGSRHKGSFQIAKGGGIWRTRDLHREWTVDQVEWKQLIGGSIKLADLKWTAMHDE